MVLCTNIPTAKHSEHSLLDAFGELPEVSKEEDAELKMKAYVNMYKKLLSSQAIKALKALGGIGKSKVDLAGCIPHDNVSP